jgi:hypothetical protein
MHANRIADFTASLVRAVLDRVQDFHFELLFGFGFAGVVEGLGEGERGEEKEEEGE